MSNHSQDGWYGFDLDGTLAVYDTWQGCDHIGEPIWPMVRRAKELIAAGENIRILTARVSFPENNAKRQLEAATAMIAIQNWCETYLGKRVPVTCRKDYEMILLFDDRAIQVEKNTGRRIDGLE
jgi:hypothetical protein